MSEPVFPYVERVMTTFVELEAYKLTNEVEHNILGKLRETEEGRCNEFGYITCITSILAIQAREIRPEDLNANAVFKVEYVCILCVPQCSPKQKDVLVFKVRQMSNSLIAVENGPMRAIIQTDHIDQSVFDVYGDAVIHKMTSEKVQPGSLLRMRVEGLKFHVYDSNIKMVGSLVDVGHSKDEELYFYDGNDDANFTVLKNKMMLNNSK